MKLTITLILIGLSPLCLAASDSGKVKQKTALEKGVSELINKAPDFHIAFEKDDYEKLKETIAETQSIIRKLHALTPQISQVQKRIYFYKVLNSLDSQLEVIKFSDDSYQSQKSKHIKKLFGSFFEIAHVYKLKKKSDRYVFYCRKDKSLWFQSSKNPKNPVNPRLQNCGRRIW